jgi:hypothetical protein
MRKEKIIKFELDLPESKVKELEAMMRKTSICTRKDLLNNALTLLQWAIKQKEKGNIITSVNETEKSIAELVMPCLETVSRQ